MTDDVSTSSGETASATIESVTRDTLTALSGEPPPPSDSDATPVSTTDAPSTAGTETPEPAAVTATGETKPPGPIPFERHKAILENERKARQPLETELQSYRQREAQFREAEEFRRAFESDPGAYWTEIGDKLAATTEGQAFLRSQAGKWLRTGKAASAADLPDDMPDADLQDREGHEVYSKGRMREVVSWLRQHLKGELQAEIAPLTQQHQLNEQRAKAQQLATDVAQKATTTLQAWRTSPGWTKELEPQIKARYADLLKAGHEAHEALGLAYAQVVVPTLGQREQAKVISSLQSKTAATTVAPGRGLSSPATRTERSVQDITRDVLSETGMLTGR